MSTLCDYVVIQGDTRVALGDDPGLTVFEKTFRLTDPHQGDLAVLSLMVQGLTAAPAPVDVKINNTTVGTITPYHYAAISDQEEVASHVYNQTMAVGSSILLDGDNEFQIEAVLLPGGGGSNAFDNYNVRTIALWYQRQV
jgi:hypothetical protein